MQENKNEYCRCENVTETYSNNNDFGLWDVCSTCNKVIEDSYEYFPDYAGQDY